MKKDQGKLVVISEQMLKTIKSPHFQRPLNLRRVPKIVNSGLQGNLIPPIVLADTNEGMYVVDGQHRLEARRKAGFDLSAIVYKMSKDEALRAFVVINTTGTRVSLYHRLMIDPDKNAIQIRAIALKYEIPAPKVCAVMNGMCGDSRNSVLTYPFTEDQFKLADKIILGWTTDKRWGKMDQSYSDNNTLRLVSSIAFKAKNYVKSLDNLKSIDYTEDSHYTKLVRSGYSGQHAARQYMREYLLEKVGM